jgi:hypothetical protein
VLVLMAAPDAPPMSMPQMVRVVVRPILEGKVSQQVATELVPVMVVADSSDAAAKPPVAADKP